MSRIRIDYDWAPVPTDYWRKMRGYSLVAKAVFQALTLHSNLERADWELDADDLALVAAEVALGHSGGWARALAELQAGGLTEDLPDSGLRLVWKIGYPRAQRERQEETNRQKQRRLRNRLQLTSMEPSSDPRPDASNQLQESQPGGDVTGYINPSATQESAQPGGDVTGYAQPSPTRSNPVASYSEEGDSSKVNVSQTARTHAHAREGQHDNGDLDTELIDSQYGDRVLVTAQLLLAEGPPLAPDDLRRRVAKQTGRDEDYVRGVLRSHQRRFVKLTDGRLDLSAEALR